MIRTATISDKEELQELFVGTVREVCKADYIPEQLAVWASGSKNEARWRDILTNQLVLVAQKERQITGFCTLHGNYIDLFYVHKDHQRQGIARQLYAEIEKAAQSEGHTELRSEVSKTARVFFEKVGFSVKKEQTVRKDSIELTNYSMSKDISQKNQPTL
jgi:putative acetyltransferase